MQPWWLDLRVAPSVSQLTAATVVSVELATVTAADVSAAATVATSAATDDAARDAPWHKAGTRRRWHNASAAGVLRARLSSLEEAARPR